MREQSKKERPLTLEGRWDILYSDYPEVYEEFVSTGWAPNEHFHLYNKFNFTGKQVVDIGSGTGASTFDLTPYAKFVIGVEPEKSMRDIAIKEAEEKGITNVRFIKGFAENIPLPDDSVDYVTAITTVFAPPEEAIPRFIEEATRVVKPGGTIVYLGVPPGFYGGDLDHVIQDEWANEKSPIADNEWRKAGFRFEDYEVEQDYGTLDKIIGIYGFIFGMNANNYLREHNKTSITWRYRWYFKTIE